MPIICPIEEDGACGYVADLAAMRAGFEKELRVVEREHEEHGKKLAELERLQIVKLAECERHTKELEKRITKLELEKRIARLERLVDKLRKDAAR